MNHFDSIFGGDNWARFLTLKSNDKITSGNLENRLLRECPTKELGFRLKGPNEWLIEATSRNQSETIINIKEITGVQVKVSRHDTLNFIQGTVVLPHIQDEVIPEKKILLESLQLRYNNVHDIEVYKIKSRKNTETELNIMKIKFTGQSIPQKIKILGQNREVRPYIPKPLQCNLCCKYGHSHKKCTSKEVCAMCGSQEHKTNWNCDRKMYLNCGEQHHAKDKKCVFHIYNTELKLLMSRTGMSAKEAKLELKVRGVTDPARNPSYRTAVTKGLNQLENQTKSKPDKNDKIEKELEEIFGDVKTGNKFNVLEEEQTREDQMEIENTNTNEKKRALDRTPPKPKKANSENDNCPGPSKEKEQENKKQEKNIKATSKHTDNLNENDSSQSPIIGEPSPRQATSLERTKNDDEITPSPIIGKPYPRLVPPYEPKENHGDEITPSPIIGKPYPRRVPPYKEKENHGDLCGCHECFINLYRHEKITTKESFLQIINNFIKDRKYEPTTSEPHKKGCMCVNHLKNYKENNTQILARYIENFNITEKKQDSTLQQPSATITESEQHKYNANYGRINSKSSSSVNHNNLTTLT